MRVIAGIAKGRALKTPRGDSTRPTSDKVRGAIFNALWSRGAPALEGARVLDLFAGTGALGIEALSRGAAHATFVEKDRHAVEVLRANLEVTRFTEQATVLAKDAEVLDGQALGAPFDLVFADPPYVLVPKSRTLTRLASLLAPGGLAVVEFDSKAPPPLPPGLVAADERRYGSTSVTFFVAED